MILLSVYFASLFLPLFIQSQAIGGTWIDDFQQHQNELDGWYIWNGYDGHTNLGNPIVQGEVNKYHGPFTKTDCCDVISRSSSMYRKFSCKSDSNVYLSFDHANCNVERSEYIRIGINGFYLSLMVYPFGGDPFETIETDNTFNNNLPTVHPDCDMANEWSYQSVSNYSLGYWNKEEIVDFRFKLEVSETDEFALIFNVEIYCDAFPTPAPTAAPSTAPSKLPTLSPTFAPSISPSLKPSLFPSSLPTLAPSLAPTLIPSLTTLAPSFAPSSAPSVAPTLTPSLVPSSTPSLAPTLAPSLAPSFTPSFAPTLTPSSPPTLAPSFPPSLSPTLTPSSPPTLAPSFSPTIAPSLAPTSSPTACLDLDDNYNTNDGFNDLNVNEIANRIDFVANISSSMIIDAANVAAFTTHAIYLNQTRPQLVCTGIVACFQSNILCSSDQTYCNILCNGYLSCSEAIIHAKHIQRVHVICIGELSCSGTTIAAQNVTLSSTIDCVNSSSCDSLSVSLIDNTQSQITCYLLNACDGLNIYTTDHVHTRLILYSYSQNIIFDNGYGLDLANNNIDCKFNRKFIRYDSTLIGNTSAIHSLIQNEYISNTFSCHNNVNFLCDNNATQTIENCALSYSVHSISTPVSYPQCYWVSISEFITLLCPGHCVTSPTFSPISAPTHAPTHTTTNPTLSPSSSPSVAPSLAPTSSPSNAPTQPPTDAPSFSPSIAPTQAPTNVPSISPSIHPTFSPSLSPSFAPSLAPTRSPSHPPTYSPSITPSHAPTQSPTDAPSFSPSSSPTQGPTCHPSRSPSIHPTLTPTITPSLPPSNVPSLSPSSAPSLHPSSTPTKPPSRYPTSAPSLVPTLTPSIAPSIAPSLTPSQFPTLSPSIAPSSAPSITPTLTPTFSPTLSPSDAPSLAPSKYPTDAPFAAPTSSPTTSPTRMPTDDTDFPWWIDIVYEIRRYAEDDLLVLSNDSVNFVETVQDILELHYFSAVSSYEMYMVQINKINDVLVQRNVEDENEVDGEDNALEIDLVIDDLHSYQLQKPIILTSQIWTQEWNIGGSIITRSTDNIRFLEPVQTDIRDYFTNNEILFTVQFIANKPLNAIPNDPIPTDWSVVILSSVIVSIASIISLGAFIVNKKSGSKVDNASFLAPMLVGLQVYDLISDVNLAIEILASHTLLLDSTLTWCGIAALFFTVVPFISNIYYAVTIHTQKVINNNTAASAYFKNHLTEFILIVVFTGGCFPGLSLVASRCFALDIFNCGLTVFELNQLSKIKIRSTITLENGPQLIIQIIYSVLIHNLPTSIILAFSASLLSIIATIAVYYAQTKAQNSEDSVAVMYSMDFCFKDTSNNVALTKHELVLFDQKKERKNELSRFICGQYKIPFESMEIGFVKVVSNGCIINIVHYVFKEQLKKFERKMHRSSTGSSRRIGFNMSIDPEYYTQMLCTTHSDAINNIICNHFELDDPERFRVKILDDDISEDLDLNKRDSMRKQIRFHRRDNRPSITEEAEEKETEELLQGSEVTVELTPAANQMDLVLMEKIQLILSETQRIYQILNTEYSDDEGVHIT